MYIQFLHCLLTLYTNKRINMYFNLQRGVFLKKLSFVMKLHFKRLAFMFLYSFFTIIFAVVTSSYNLHWSNNALFSMILLGVIIDILNLIKNRKYFFSEDVKGTVDSVYFWISLFMDIVFSIILIVSFIRIIF